MNTARLSTDSFMVLLLATISTVFGCGVVPAGQASIRPFTVSGFTTLPLPMVYSSTPQVRFPGIAPDEAAARGFVHRLVKQTVFDVLERQGRSALLSDALISAILGQLSIQINYKPMNCEAVISPTDKTEKSKDYCIIAGDMVMGICSTTDKGMDKMCTATAAEVTVTPINATYLTIPGTISTSNIIMAKWSGAMWQSVVNRAVRILAFGTFGSTFSSASATVGGN
ncbi:hypothetical protein KIN20_030165 [Parelaphostrongylus tenuis]|uniref:Uncharacterized protein n=1 Tax=Parelaphostrongylus tenuis TaxID=148309 RepID=A0AAD5WG46_PARTN|nr:hypothetical protein KIN20_030165 [Parelaphostrongylus tenuis]